MLTKKYPKSKNVVDKRGEYGVNRSLKTNKNPQTVNRAGKGPNQNKNKTFIYKRVK
jgi:hypothetical protein